MKLRVKLNKQTTRLELEGEEPTVTDLTLRVKEILLPSYGLGPDTEFMLSLNGKEPLGDAGQTLTSCGIVSGDLICVTLPQSSPLPSPPPCPTPLAPGHRAADPLRAQSERRPHTAQHAQEATSSTSRGSQRSAMDEQAERVDMEEEDEEEADVGPFVPEPMLCSEAEEGRVPHSLELLHGGAQSQGPCDCLMVALHLLMLESGYLPQGSDVRQGEMPIGWRAAGGVYRLQYSHPLCENCLTMLVAVPMGQSVVINATLKINSTVDNVRKLSLKPSSYVTQAWAGEDAIAVYKGLKKLSRVFKDQIVYPLMANARQAMGLPALFGLAVLPPELQLRILRLLDVSSLLSLSAVSRDLHTATDDPALWRHLYHRDFRVCHSARPDPRDTDWKELYQKRHRQRREMSRLRHRPYPYPTRPVFPNPPVPVPVPLPLYPPGIIGGEYDQRPGIPGLLPRPRFDPIGPLPGYDPDVCPSSGRRSMRPGQGGSRPADIRRGFI